MGEVDETLLGKVKIGDVVHIEIDKRITYHVTPIRGRWVEGDYVCGLQITCSQPSASSHLLPEETKAYNQVRKGEAWFFGPQGLHRGGLVTGIRHP